jgi:hypothetical protein
MANNPWRLLITALLAFFITSCDKSSDSDKTSATPVSAAQAQVNEKFAVFIKAANSEYSIDSYSLPEAFYKYQREVEPQLRASLTSYSVVNPAIFRTVSDLLSTGLVLPGELPPLDEAARRYKASLDKILPVSETLYAYSQKKGWLNDNGALARGSNAEYVTAFKALLIERDRFLKAISVANSERIKMAYENSPANSAEHYRNGIVYLSRQALHELNMSRTENEDRVLNDRVQTLSQLSDGWNQLLQQQGNDSCQTIIHAANAYISVMRAAMAQQAQGAEMPEEKIILPFNALVQALTTHRHC